MSIILEMNQGAEIILPINMGVPGPQGEQGTAGTANTVTWTATTFTLGSQVNYLGKDWVSNAATLSTDIPGTSSKWVERLSGYVNNYIQETADDLYDITDANGNVAFRINALGEVVFKSLDTKTIARLKILLDLQNNINFITTTIGGGFEISDPSGNVAFKINTDGTTILGKLDSKSLDKLKNELQITTGGTTTTVNKKIYGKNISVLGDSISTDNGGGNAGLVEPQQYWGKLKSIQNCSVFRNAVGGTTIANSGTGNPMNTPARWESLNSTFAPDLIFIFGGINDFLQDVPLGVKTDTTVTTFYGALDYLYKSILTRNPNTRLYHITPLHTTYSQSGGLVPEYNGQNFLSDYIEAIQIVCRRYGVGIVDANRDSGITAFNIGTLSGDNIHIKEVGHTMVYNLIVNTIEANL